jgi:hypothetical protein
LKTSKAFCWPGVKFTNKFHKKNDSLIKGT